ncbi:hypothetical protein ACIRF8_15050 [Streptomyces sp. NPDC102406]|uniref:hypothetical protein n=1 Tax=Streptomyces sp. NPDC102406 TaxID=3366171 RepID=UPI00382B5A49
MTAETRTPQPLTDEQLTEIQARVDAATAGPWGFYDGDTYADVAADLKMTGRASYSYREKVAHLEDENYWDDPAHENDDENRAPEQMAANVEFIAHARTDVPALLAEVARLRGEVTAAVDRLRDMQRLEPNHARAAGLYGVEMQLRYAIGTEEEAAS